MTEVPPSLEINCGSLTEPASSHLRPTVSPSFKRRVARMILTSCSPAKVLWVSRGLVWGPLRPWAPVPLPPKCRRQMMWRLRCSPWLGWFFAQDLLGPGKGSQKPPPCAVTGQLSQTNNHPDSWASPRQRAVLPDATGGDSPKARRSLSPIHRSPGGEARAGLTPCACLGPRSPAGSSDLNPNSS